MVGCWEVFEKWEDREDKETKSMMDLRRHRMVCTRSLRWTLIGIMQLRHNPNWYWEGIFVNTRYPAMIVRVDLRAKQSTYRTRKKANMEFRLRIEMISQRIHVYLFFFAIEFSFLLPLSINGPWTTGWSNFIQYWMRTSASISRFSMPFF